MSRIIGWSSFCAVEKIRVTAHLAQLHENVEEAEAMRAIETVEFVCILT
jgi:hypothetical protein